MDSFSLSLPIGTYAGVAVRVHFTFLIVAWYFLQGFGDNLIFGMVVIFVGYFLSILLHEFGHVLAARYCDGEATDIVMWAFGGLAMCRPIFHPTAALITTVAGPFVTLVLWGLFGVLRYLMEWGRLDWLDPGIWSYMFKFVAQMEYLNRWLLFFNLIPAFPMDGGRILQETLWYRLGWERAMIVTLVVSRCLAVVGMIVGFGGIWGGSWVGILSLMVFFQASQQAMAEAATAIIQPFSLRERLGRFSRRRAFFGGVAEAERVKVEQSFHVCVVCGKTERDSAELVFRVASDGKEYCVNHLPSRGAGLQR